MAADFVTLRAGRHYRISCPIQLVGWERLAYFLPVLTGDGSDTMMQSDALGKLVQGGRKVGGVRESVE